MLINMLPWGHNLQYALFMFVHVQKIVFDEIMFRI